MNKQHFNALVNYSITSRNGLVDRDKLFNHVYHAEQDFFKGASSYIRSEIGEINASNEDDLYIELSAYCVDYYSAIVDTGVESLKISEFLDFMKEEQKHSGLNFFYKDNLSIDEFFLITEELQEDAGLIRKDELLGLCYENNGDLAAGFYDYYAINFSDNFNEPLKPTALDKIHVELLAFADRYSKVTNLDVDYKKLDEIFASFKHTYEEVNDIKRRASGVEFNESKSMNSRQDYLVEITALLNGDKEALKEFGFTEKVYSNEDSLGQYFVENLMSASKVHSGYFIRKGYGLDQAKDDQAHLIFYRDVGVEYIVNRAGDVYMAYQDDCELMLENDKSNMFYRLATQYYGFQENHFVITDEEVIDRRKEFYLVSNKEPDVRRNKMKI